MLIKCPECGQNISDQSDQCIHCGYPLSKIPKIKVSNEQCPICKGNRHVLNGIEDKCGICGYVYNEKECQQINPSYQAYPNIQSNQPKCPTCGSTNIEKIYTAKKAAGGFMFGLFSKTAKSQFACKDCGYKW